MKVKTHYESLEVCSVASAETISAAYKSLAKRFHPDKNLGDKTSEEKFKAISQAYTVLSDPEKRKKYDGELRARKFAEQAQKGTASAGSGKKQGRRSRQAVAEADASIGLDDLAMGMIDSFLIPQTNAQTQMAYNAVRGDVHKLVKNGLGKLMGV